MKTGVKGIDYQDDAYNALKKKIDNLWKLKSLNGASLEFQKGALLAECEPYVEFLSRITRRDKKAVKDAILELSGDQEFFSLMENSLKSISDLAAQGLHTGELRVHSYTDYVAVRLMKPETMVETGVANGKSSAFILRALQKNGMGKLYSIDLPQYEGTAPRHTMDAIVPKGRTPGWLVPDVLRKWWVLKLGDSKALLPKLKKELPRINIFQHDSLHTYDHVMFELNLATDGWVAKDGLMLCDDIQMNDAFPEQAASLNWAAFGTFGGLWF